MYFEGFELQTIECGEVSLRVRHGGDGPPVVLLHGHARTHATWHQVAARLADRYTVVCPDMRGYGRSTVPPDEERHAQASKRAMGNDFVALMDALGHDRFAIVGHDRGAYAAFRTAMDHQQRVAALTTIGHAAPILEAVERMGFAFARDWWHWFYLAQTEKPAEDAIAALGPDRWYQPEHGPEVMGAEAHADMWEALRNPAVVHAMCEDYRAGLTVDIEHDRADRDAGRKLGCPVQVLWAEGEDNDLLEGGPLGLMRNWAPDLRGGSIDGDHHVAEDAPEETVAQLTAFWEEIGWTGSGGGEGT